MGVADGTAKSPSVDSEVTAEKAVDLFRQLVLVRKFEEMVRALFLKGEIYGSCHLCLGQEAVAVGVSDVVGDDDLVAATYRGHGYVLALGEDPQRFLEELMGRATGTCGGRAGSMNVVDLKHRLLGCFGIIGGSLAAATGAAIALRRTGGVAIGCLGDGAANQAYFMECLNFAKVLSLPVVYICENNHYGEFTRMETVTAGGSITARAAALEIPTQRVDGQDVWSVRSAARAAIERARGGEGPVFIEAVTYRYGDHGRGDPIKYRPDDEVQAWKDRDPIKIARARLEADYRVSVQDLDETVIKVEETLANATEAARQAPFPQLDDAASAFAQE